MTPYEVLGVSPRANRKDIAVAYKVMAQIFHPDRYAGSPESVQHEVDRRMKELNRAYALARKGPEALAQDMASTMGREARDRASAATANGATAAWQTSKRVDRAAKEHNARLRANRAARAQTAQTERHGDARSQPKGRATFTGNGREAIFGFGRALHFNQVGCRDCKAVLRLPAGWQEQLDHLEYVCCYCGRLVMGSGSWGRVPPRLADPDAWRSGRV